MISNGVACPCILQIVSRGELFCSISCYMHHTCISWLWDMYDSYFDSPHFLVDLACFTGVFQNFNLNVFSIESSVLKHVVVALDCFSIVYYGFVFVVFIVVVIVTRS